VPKEKPVRTTDKRKKEFMEKLAQFESSFGGFPTVMAMYDGMAELLVTKGICTELEIIKAVEKIIDENGEKFRARQMAQPNHM